MIFKKLLNIITGKAPEQSNTREKKKGIKGLWDKIRGKDRGCILPENPGTQ